MGASVIEVRLPAEGLTMPGEEGLGPHNEERLSPVPDSPCKQQQEESIGLATRWALHLTAKDDQLLSQQDVLGDEFGLGASEVGECSREAGAARWPGPPQYMLPNPNE